MRKLKAGEIEKLKDFLKADGITYDKLKEEIIDHLICDIEAQMKQGKKFEEAWTDTQK